MTRVSFYVLDAEATHSLQFLCRLIARVQRGGQSLYVHCGDTASQDELDSLLWTFEQGSFLPHEVHRGGDVAAAPILLGCGQPPATPREVLINLATEVPEFFSSFDRCLELVAGDSAAREASRARYRFYKDRGYPLDNHKIDSQPA